MTNEELVRAFYEPFNSNDTSIYSQILDESWVDIPMAPGQEPGPGGMTAHIAGFHEAFPDYNVTNEALIVDGDHVAVRSTVTGTHRGPFMGQAPTGRPIRIRTMDLKDLKNEEVSPPHR